MALLGPRGKNFIFAENRLTIFDRRGKPHGTNWMLGQKLPGGDFSESICSPVPARGLLEEVIALDTEEGKTMEIVRVDVSADIAARLYLENFITREMFRTACEGSHRISGTINAEFVCIPNVSFPADLTLPLYIYSVEKRGEVFVATINSEGKVV